MNKLEQTHDHYSVLEYIGTLEYLVSDMNWKIRWDSRLIKRPEDTVLFFATRASTLVDCTIPTNRIDMHLAFRCRRTLLCHNARSTSKRPSQLNLDTFDSMHSTVNILCFSTMGLPVFCTVGCRQTQRVWFGCWKRSLKKEPMEDKRIHLHDT